MFLVFIVRIFSCALLIPLFGLQTVGSDAETSQEAYESDAAEDAPG
jgi:hypothetical protein